MKKSLKIIVFLSLLGIFSACAPPDEEEEVKERRELVLPVQIGKVVYRDVVDEIRAVGNIQAEQRVLVTSEISGKILKIFVEEGQGVSEGDMLASIDARDYRLEVETLKAYLQVAEKDYEITTRGLRPEEQEKLRARVRADESGLNLALKEQARLQKLVDEKIVSESELDIAIDKARQAKEILHSMRAELAAGLSSRDEEIAKKKSDYEASKRKLESAELALSKTAVLAPFDGVILSKKIEQGAFASPGTPIVEMIGSAKLKAVIELPQSYRGKLNRLRGVEFSIKELGLKFKQTRNLRRRVRVIPDANIYSGNIRVQIDLPRPNPALFPGLTLESLLRFDTRFNVMHIPAVALVITEQGTVVYTVKEQRAHMVPVKAFKERGGFVEIDDFSHKLGPETDLILRGSGAVFPGVKVKQTNPEPKSETPFNAVSREDRGNKQPARKPKT